MSMSVNDKPSSAAAVADMRSTVFNLPNQLTWLRLVLSIVMFGLISFDLYLPSLVLFIIAAGTDWLDGYFARKYNLVTTLGRILDPFADKVIICGTFVFLAAKYPVSGVHAAMTVIIIGRELLVTALRSFLEQQGADFSATISGKLKMGFQCAAAILSLFCLYYAHTIASVPFWLRATLLAAVWGAVLLTIISGIAYIRTAVNILRR